MPEHFIKQRMREFMSRAYPMGAAQLQLGAIDRKAQMATVGGRVMGAIAVRSGGWLFMASIDLGASSKEFEAQLTDIEREAAAALEGMLASHARAA